MILLLQAAPLILLAGLLAARRGPIPAVAAAIAASLPAAWVTLPESIALPGFLAAEMPRALWLAFIPTAVVTGGLALHDGLAARRVAPPPLADSDPLFTAAFLLGPFAENLTGFGVGVVFALGAARRAGLSGAPSVAIALFALVLVPWGGLGPGTVLGAALAHVPVQDMALRTALCSAVWLLPMLALFWRIAARAGRPVPPSRRMTQCGWVVALGALLTGAHLVLPFEVAGLAATGPLLAIRLARGLDLRRPEVRRGAFGAAWPYAALAAVLLATRFWSTAPTLGPFADLPDFPLTHAAVVLWIASLTLLFRDGHGARRLATVLRRAARPALTILLYVVFARLMAASGTSTALATAFAGAFGTAAPYAAPLLGVAAGLVAGTNVGSNATMMPIQAALGRLAGLPAPLLPAVQNFTGSSSCLLAPQMLAVATALTPSSERPSPAAIWRLMWPALPATVAVGLAAVALG